MKPPSEKQRKVAAAAKAKIERILDSLDTDGLCLRVSTQGGLYICALDETFETAGVVASAIVYSTIPWDEEQIIRSS